MRIAITGETYYPGSNGQAIFTIHLAEGLARAGHEVHMFAPGDGLKYHWEMLNGVKVHYLPAIDLSWIHPETSLHLPARRLIERIFQESPPDVVHIQDHFFISRDLAAVCYRQKIPIAGTNHFLPENLLPYLRWLPLPRAFKIKVLWMLMLWTYNRLDIVTTPTETAASILRAQKIRVQVVPVSCGVDTNHFTPATPSEVAALKAHFGLDGKKTNIFYVGRQDHEKRIDLLLRGLAILRDQGRDDIHLTLAGKGVARDDLQALMHSLHLEDRARFLGYVPNQQLPDLYRAGDVFGMPSPEELQSIATLEAMASGKPVLAARARALPELVEHRVNGWLCEPGSAQAVAEGMAFLADSRPSWPIMGQASRARAVAHSLENTIRGYESIYLHAMGRQPAAEASPIEKNKFKRSSLHPTDL